MVCAYVLCIFTDDQKDLCEDFGSFWTRTLPPYWRSFAALFCFSLDPVGPFERFRHPQERFILLLDILSILQTNDVALLRLGVAEVGGLRCLPLY